MQKIRDCYTLSKRNEVTSLNCDEIFKIKLALSSLSNSVIMCPMIAHVYIKPATEDDTWTHFKRGVPVAVLHHDIDRIITSVQFCLADPYSGFAIWRESLSDLSKYKATQNNFHTFELLSKQGYMAGVKFPSEDGPCNFLRNVQDSIPKSSNTELTFSKVMVASPFLRRLRREGDSHSSMRKKINKDEISTPCMFTHVTSATMIKRKTKSRESSRLPKDTKSNKFTKNPGAPSPLLRKQNSTNVCF